ncbi:MAG TPA: hypothetical protein VGL97_04815 [Bryobacteraceae bacterium]
MRDERRGVVAKVKDVERWGQRKLSGNPPESAEYKDAPEEKKMVMPSDAESTTSSRMTSSTAAGSRPSVGSSRIKSSAPREIASSNMSFERRRNSKDVY